MSTMRHGRFFATPDKTFTQDLSAAALSYTSDYATPIKLEQIRIHSSVAITEQVTITLDSITGANYDHKLRTINMNNTQDASWIPDGEVFLRKGDQVKVQCTNANTTGVVYGEIIASEA